MSVFRYKNMRCWWRHSFFFELTQNFFTLASWPSAARLASGSCQNRSHTGAPGGKWMCRWVNRGTRWVLGWMLPHCTDIMLGVFLLKPVIPLCQVSPDKVGVTLPSLSLSIPYLPNFHGPEERIRLPEMPLRRRRTRGQSKGTLLTYLPLFHAHE